MLIFPYIVICTSNNQRQDERQASFSRAEHQTFVRKCKDLLHTSMNTKIVLIFTDIMEYFLELVLLVYTTVLFYRDHRDQAAIFIFTSTSVLLLRYIYSIQVTMLWCIIPIDCCPNRETHLLNPLLFRR